MVLALAGCILSPGPVTPEVDTMNMSLESPAFDDGGRMPEKYGYTRENVNPPLEISGVPEDAESLVLVMDDPDAIEPAGKVWDHWVLYDIPAGTGSIGEDSVPDGAEEGINDYGETGYGGPNPPDGEHTYVFKLYALDSEVELGEGATKEEVENAMRDHLLDQATLEGTYAPPQ